MRLYELVDRMSPDPLPGFDASPAALAALEPLGRTFIAQKPLHKPPVSVIISTLNRAAYLGRTLQSLLQLRYPHFEVVVVEGPSSDDTGRLLDQWGPRIKRASCDRPNLSASRNIGIAAAGGNLLAFIDDDAVPEPDWLDRLVEPFRDPTVGATGGAIRNWTGWRYQCRALTVDIGAKVRRTTIDELATGDICPAFTGTNFCIRRDAAVAAGMFDEAYAYHLGESDLQQLLFRVGMRLVYIDGAEVHHLRAPNAHRDSDRLPQDYVAKLRSVAYFCMKHRLDDDDRSDVLVRIARQIELTAGELRRFLRKNRIEEAAAAQRLRSAFRGLRDGIKLYGDRAAARGAALPPARLPGLRFRRFHAETKTALRVAVICRGANQAAGLASAKELVEALAQKRCEVTLVKYGPENTVEYSGTHWVHERKRRGVAARAGRNLSLNLALAELRRVEANRNFDVVVDLVYTRSFLTMGTYQWLLYREKSTRVMLLRPDNAKARLEKIEPERLAERVDDVATACLRLYAEQRTPTATAHLRIGWR